jgi:hypothetical protein
VKRQPFTPCPTMSGHAGSHGWRGRATGVRQTRVRGTEIIDRAAPLPPVWQGQQAAGQGQASAGQRRHACPPWGVQPLHGGRMEPAVVWRAVSPCLDASRGPGDEAALNPDDAARGASGNNTLNQVRRGLGRTPARTRGTKPPPFATEGQEDLLLAGITSQAQKAMGKDAALQIIIKFALYIGGQASDSSDT